MVLIRDIAIVLLVVFVSWLGGEQRGALVKMFQEHGIAVGTGIVLIIVVLWWIFRLNASIAESARQLAADREREIERLSHINDRLIAENSEYHDRFLRIIDKISDMEDKK